MMEPGTYDRRSLLRQGAAAFLVGAAGGRAAVWGWGGRGGGEPTAQAPVEVWVADHAAHKVVGLDRDGIPIRLLHVPGPIQVRAMGRGRLQIHSATAAGVAPRLWTWAHGQGLRPQGMAALQSAAPSDLPVPHGQIAAIESTDFSCPAPSRQEPCHSGFTCHSGFSRPGHWLLRRVTHESVGGRVDQVAPLRLERWVGALSTWTPRRRAFRIRLDFRPRALAAAQGGGVWVAGGDRCCEVALVSSAGDVRMRRTLRDVDRACAVVTASARAGGGVWLGSGSAVARIDANGTRRPGQGGFRHVRALALGHRT